MTIGMWNISNPAQTIAIQQQAACILAWIECVLKNLIIVEKHAFAGPNKVDDCQNEHMVMICRNCSKIGHFLNADDHGKSGNLSAVEMVFTLEINIMADRRIPINIPMNVEGKYVNL